MFKHRLVGPEMPGSKNLCDAECSMDEQGGMPCTQTCSSCRCIREILRYHASHDPQTKLPNLDLLIKHTSDALAVGRSCSVVFLIVLGVNEIGEHHGVAAALHAIQEVSSRIRARVLNGGLAARIQGDLFAVVSYEQDAATLAHLLWADLTCPIHCEGEEFFLVVSAGVVGREQGGGTAEALIQNGYAAAKDCLDNNLRGGVRLFSHDLGQRIERQYQVEVRLRSALEGDGLSLMLQSKVAAEDGRLLGAEALIRWRDEKLGMVPPSEFIPLAERNGSITIISSWVLRQALAQARAWQLAGLDLSIAVNLSAIDLHHPDLVADIQNALSASGCDPSRLIIELTESAVAEDPDLAIKQMLELKSMGISISLDDFGTGYSSLSYLRRFPIDTLKIDISFVTDIPHDADAVAIVRSIVALAQSLGMQTVAEGVETAEQALFLRNLGVDVLQGYLFSRPMPPEQFLALAIPEKALAAFGHAT